MGIFIILAALLTLVGIIGVIVNLAVPAWRPRGSRRAAATVRLSIFAVLAIMGVIAVIVLASTGSGTIQYGAS